MDEESPEESGRVHQHRSGSEEASSKKKLTVNTRDNDDAFDMKCLTDMLKSALLRNRVEPDNNAFYQRFMEKASKQEYDRGRPKFIDADVQSNYSQQSPMKKRHDSSDEKQKAHGNNQFYF